MDIYAIILYMRRPGERCSQTVGVPATSFTGLRELAFAPVPMRLLLGLLLAGFAVAQYPQNSSIVLLFQAAGLPSGTLNTWPDASVSPNFASPLAAFAMFVA